MERELPLLAIQNSSRDLIHLSMICLVPKA